VKEEAKRDVPHKKEEKKKGTIIWQVKGEEMRVLLRKF